MPTVASEGSFRLYFSSNENQTRTRPEPPYIHVECRGAEAEFWLNPDGDDISFKANTGLSRQDFSKAEALARKYRQEAIMRWNEHFGSDDARVD
jgi:hypothetical protein